MQQSEDPLVEAKLIRVNMSRRVQLWREKLQHRRLSSHFDTTDLWGDFFKIILSWFVDSYETGVMIQIYLFNKMCQLIVLLVNKQGLQTNEFGDHQQAR